MAEEVNKMQAQNEGLMDLKLGHEETADNNTNDLTGDVPTLTKSQLKKLKKKEKREAMKGQKRKEEKERAKARKRAMRERGEELGPSRKELKHNKMSYSSCKTQVVIDCDFDDYMTEKDIKMLVKQIQFSYSANRRALNPLQFYCCGISGKTEERLKSLGDYRGWDVRFRSESYLEAFDKSSVVYLSSESPNMLDTLQDDKVYIIGGLVDHNHHKGLCHRLAEEKGIAHAQLPISDYINMKTRKVFTINHVFEMLLRYTETKDWQKAFFTVLPPRKGAVMKNLELSKDGGATPQKDDTAEDNCVKMSEKDKQELHDEQDGAKCDDRDNTKCDSNGESNANKGNNSDCSQDEPSTCKGDNSQESAVPTINPVCSERTVDSSCDKSQDGVLNITVS